MIHIIPSEFNKELKLQLAYSIKAGFPEDKLDMTRHFLQMDNCDMLDVLSYLAYETTPIDRERRAQILLEDSKKKLSEKQQEFVDFIMFLYIRNGFKELAMDKLGVIIDMKYHSMMDAIRELKMQPEGMRTLFLGMQRDLYNGRSLYKAS